MIKNLCLESNEHVQYLFSHNHITRRESLAMQVTHEKQKIPPVYLKPKINKPFYPSTGTFQARAVVSTFRGPLYALDKYMSKITSPIMAMLRGLLKNSESYAQMIIYPSTFALPPHKSSKCIHPSTLKRD